SSRRSVENEGTPDPLCKAVPDFVLTPRKWVWRTLFRVWRWSDNECTDQFGHVTVYFTTLLRRVKKSTGSQFKVSPNADVVPNHVLSDESSHSNIACVDAFMPMIAR
ncbi:hypothetical protein ASPFODRAFT_120832, partial [Aspergillus luchuensis CBS 106.47]